MPLQKESSSEKPILKTWASKSILKVKESWGVVDCYFMSRGFKIPKTVPIVSLERGREASEKASSFKVL